LDKLEDMFVENVMLDAKAKHTIMECVKAKAEMNALRVVVRNQARLMMKNFI